MSYRSDKPNIEHLIIEIKEIDKKRLIKVSSILPFIKKCTKRLNLKIVRKQYYNFKPFGATLLFILSGSHLSVHTWPEKKYLHLDLLLCKKTKRSSEIKRILSEIFLVKKQAIKIKRVNYD